VRGSTRVAASRARPVRLPQPGAISSDRPGSAGAEDHATALRRSEHAGANTTSRQGPRSGTTRSLHHDRGRDGLRAREGPVRGPLPRIQLPEPSHRGTRIQGIGARAGRRCRASADATVTARP
jgi:hypothetical protein